MVAIVDCGHPQQMKLLIQICRRCEQARRPKKRVERVAWLSDDGYLQWGKSETDGIFFELPSCDFAAEIQRVLKPSRTRKIRLIAEALTK